jgi:Kef-type K+ transport system membrane component KefB/mannitol/fructose-specific phosphotransferase system IIA component (Ntr-type)
MISLFLALGVVLAAARVLGEIARRFNQPAVMGELLAGILLGPTLLGAVAPELFAQLFPDTTGFKTAMQGLTTVAISLFLLVAGLEVDLSTVFRQGRSAIGVSIGGIAIPFAVGFGLGWVGPLLFEPAAIGRTAQGDALVFALFLATAMSISALPVIAKTLMDLNLYRSDMGMTVIASAVFDDLLGWIIFAILLGLMGASAHNGHGIGFTVGMVLAYVAFMLTVGRFVLHRALPFVQAHTSWPGGVLGMAVALAMLGAALMEWAGIHAIFGAFLVGVALGDSSHLKERTRHTLENFVTFIFAPLFFATVGLKVDFLANFDLPLVAVVMVVACAGKLIGCGLAARLGGMPWRESWAIGAAMNARGAMEIILALLALQAGLINEKLFVALVIMALATSVIAGPIMQRILRRKKARRFTDYVGAASFVPELAAANRFAAIIELCHVSGATGVPIQTAIDLVIARERAVPTGVGNGIALPHARVPGLDKPQVAVGISRVGLDFDSPDGEPVHIICLILTREEDHALTLELYRDILQSLATPAARAELLKVRTYTEFLALLASARGEAATAAPAPTVAADWLRRRDEKARAAPRAGTLIIGASPAARALGKALAGQAPVCLVDINPARVADAQADGLNAVHGNALEDAVLRRAGGEQAARVVALTANADINVMAVRKAKDALEIPAAMILSVPGGGQDTPTLQHLGASRLFGREVNLPEWDHWFERNEVRLERFDVEGRRPDELLAWLDSRGVYLPLAIERAGTDNIPFHQGYEPAAGDTLVAACATGIEAQSARQAAAEG